MLLVVCSGPNDWLDILALSRLPFRLAHPDYLSAADLEGAEAVALLAERSGPPLLLGLAARTALEEAMTAGTRVFCEYALSIGDVYSDEPASTRRRRLVALSAAEAIAGITPGDILDDWGGLMVRPWYYAGEPLLAYAAVAGHDRATAMPAPAEGGYGEPALWEERPGRLLIASFRLSAAHTGRYGPIERWRGLTRWVLAWLLGREVEVTWPAPVVWHEAPHAEAEGRTARAAAAADRAIEWFHRAGMLVDEGRGGVLEGFGTEVAADGSQPLRRVIRGDCIGETSWAFLCHYRLTGERRSLDVARNLAECRRRSLQAREPGPLYGMGRWSNQAWSVCYQDDVARAIIPAMLLGATEGPRDLIDASVEALDFLVRTTSPDGTRVMRTDAPRLDARELVRLRTEPARFPSAHYNASYWAALILGHRLTGREEFMDVARRGLGYIMSVYPATEREMSETEENCRLVLPLAWLYAATGEAEHLGWLEQVRRRLLDFRHPSGAFLEWDSGYRAARRAVTDETFAAEESSLLTANGEPVADLLYSNNWLAVALPYALTATADGRFTAMWEGLADFLCAAQVRSHVPWLDGAWARAFDLERHEVFGSSSDIGWGPWAIETGWTVANLAAGLAMYAAGEAVWPASSRGV